MKKYLPFLFPSLLLAAGLLLVANSNQFNEQGLTGSISNLTPVTTSSGSAYTASLKASKMGNPGEYGVLSRIEIYPSQAGLFLEEISFKLFDTQGHAINNISPTEDFSLRIADPANPNEQSNGWVETIKIASMDLETGKIILSPPLEIPFVKSNATLKMQTPLTLYTWGFPGWPDLDFQAGYNGIELSKVIIKNKDGKRVRGKIEKNKLNIPTNVKAYVEKAPEYLSNEYIKNQKNNLSTFKITPINGNCILHSAEISIFQQPSGLTPVEFKNLELLDVATGKSFPIEASLEASAKYLLTFNSNKPPRIGKNKTKTYILTGEYKNVWSEISEISNLWGKIKCEDYASGITKNAKVIKPGQIGNLINTFEIISD